MSRYNDSSYPRRLDPARCSISNYLYALVFASKLFRNSFARPCMNGLDSSRWNQTRGASLQCPASSPAAQAMPNISILGMSAFLRQYLCPSLSLIRVVISRLDDDYVVFRGSEAEAASAHLKGTLVLCLSEPLSIKRIKLHLTGVSRIG